MIAISKQIKLEIWATTQMKANFLKFLNLKITWSLKILQPAASKKRPNLKSRLLEGRWPAFEDDNTSLLDEGIGSSKGEETSCFGDQLSKLLFHYLLLSLNSRKTTAQNDKLTEAKATDITSIRYLEAKSDDDKEPFRPGLASS